MENLHQIFIQEAAELLSELEDALLSFEDDLTDEDAVQGIFRVMHTLKGSSGMFGYSMVNDFTHELEFIYDGIREKKIIATHEILDLTLKSVDHLKQLINNPLNTSNEVKSNQKGLLDEIKKHTNSNANTFKKEVVEAHEDEKCYYIRFAPNKTILKHGTNPNYILEDLIDLGNGIILPSIDRIPILSELTYQDFYMSFEIVLVTHSNVKEIEEIFMFVEDDANIQIHQFEFDINLNTDLISELRESAIEQRPLGIDNITKILSIKDQDSRLSSGFFDPQNKGQNGTPSKSEDKQTDSIRVSSLKLDEMMNQISELVTTQARLNMLVNDTGDNELSAITEGMNKITRALRGTAFSICLIPIDNLMLRFKRLIRDLSKELDKDIEFITSGTETELDKSILDKLSDPLLHLVRNCIDHGIETKDQRLKSGKATKGKISLEAYNSGTNVVIELKDDGRGIDKEKIIQKALKNKLIKADENLTENEIYNLLFHPGFSTASTVTDISGRGVGMDVAKRGIEDIQGAIRIESTLGKGTSFKISLPLTLSIIDGLLVSVGNETFILPLQHVEKCYELPGEFLLNTNQPVVLDDKRMTVFNLREAFGYKQTQQKLYQVIKTKFEGSDIGLAVDTIIGEHQVVLKPLGTMYNDQQEYSGATILGNGSVALVFDVNKLVTKLTSGEYQKLNERKYAKQK